MERDPLYRPLPDSYQLPPEPPAPPKPEPGHSWGRTAAAGALVVGTVWLLKEVGSVLWGTPTPIRFGSPGPFSSVLLAVVASAASFPIAWGAVGILYSWWMGRPSKSKGVRLARRASVYLILASWGWILWGVVNELMSLSSRGLR